MNLTDSISDFRNGIAKVNRLVSKAFDNDATGISLFDEAEKEFIVSSAFLKMFIYWETFLEESFASYLDGKLSTSGTTVNTYVTPLDRAHAKKILIGTQKYVDWANYEVVLRLCRLYLDNGEPFSSNLSSIKNDLTDLRTIRNAAAHCSSTTQPQLDALASRLLGNSISNCSVSYLILHLDPRDSSQTILLRYQSVLDLAAENIAANIV